MNKNTTHVIIGILVVVLVVAFCGIGWLLATLNQTNQEAMQARQALATQQQAQVVAQQAQAAAAEKTQDDKLKITWPSRGATLCYENEYSVSWQAPVDMDAVTITLRTPTMSTMLGDFPATNGNNGDVGFNSFTWDLTNKSGSVVPESQVYKMDISGMYHGHQISTSTDGVFSISECK